jgi:hypothetical protein
LSALADTVGEVNRSVRCHLQLDEHEPVRPDEIDHRLNGFLPPPPPEQPAEPAAPPRGKKSRAEKPAAE